MSEQPKEPSIAVSLPTTSITVRVKEGKVVSRIVRNEHTAEEWARIAKSYSDKPLIRAKPRRVSREP